MVKNRTITKAIGNFLFVGLLVGTLPAGLPLNAQSLPKISKTEVEKEIKAIKKTVRQLRIANAIIPGLIVAAGATVALVAIGFTLLYRRKMLKSPLDEIVTYIVREGKMIKVPDKAFYQTKSRRVISILVAISTMVVTPIAALLSAIGIGGGTLVEAFDRAERLEQMEKEYPGTLTHKQKIEIARLKNMYKDPITRGVIKYFRMKNALKIAANTAIQNNRKLITSIGRGKKKKARKTITQYIKAKWKIANLKRSVEETEKQSTKAKLKWNLSYKIAQSKLKKAEKKVAELEKKYPSLKTLEQTVHAYEKKISSILEGVPGVTLKQKGPMPRIVPL